MEHSYYNRGMHDIPSTKTYAKYNGKNLNNWMRYTSKQSQCAVAHTSNYCKIGPESSLKLF